METDFSFDILTSLAATKTIYMVYTCLEIGDEH